MITYGKVVARVVELRGDADDEDEYPDVLGATTVTVSFVPKVNAFISVGEQRIVNAKPIICTVDETGIMRDAEGIDGVWLMTGQYGVKFSGSHHPDITINVTESHTNENPLNLGSAIPYVPPPATTVQTVSLPTGAANGQALAWLDGALVWTDVAFTAFYVGNTPPDDTSKVWIDTSGL